jgi:hypothetical protein
MLKDPVEEVVKLVRFIGVQPTSEQIHKAVEQSSFDKMKAIEEKKGLGSILDASNPKIRFVRKGEKGRWQEEFGDKEIALVKRRYGDALVRAGYESSLQW